VLWCGRGIVPQKVWDSANRIPSNLITWTGNSPQKDLVYGVFHWSKGSLWRLVNASFPNTYGSNPDYGYTDYNISATHAHVFSPTMINELRGAGGARERQDRPEYGR
jgi:hypothetical protein